MIVIGAKGHASEMYSSLLQSYDKDVLYFFDNLSINRETQLCNIPIIKDEKGVLQIFKKDPQFTLGIGNPLLREKLALKFMHLGGEFVSVIDSTSNVDLNSSIGTGVNTMPYSGVFFNSVIERGVLVNSYASVHHDCFVGEFSELSPGCRILGNAKIGRLCSVGSNATILPGIEICNNVRIGAGAVVTKNITVEGTYVGIPAIKN